MTSKEAIILIDMDGVLADFENGFISQWRLQHPDKPYIKVEDRTTFYSSEQYPLKWRPLVWKIMRAPNFFADLPAIEGGVKAVKKMVKSGLDVYFCSSPLIPNRTGASEKYDWIEKHFGRKWMRRLILAPDKTLVHGDILIDDRPNIEGAGTPSWEHVLYDQPYNRGIKNRRRLSWANWEEVISPKTR